VCAVEKTRTPLAGQQPLAPPASGEKRTPRVLRGHMEENRMTRIAWMFPALALSTFAGCTSKNGDDSGTPGDGGTGDGGSGCTAEVDSTWPANGETSAYYRTNVEFDLSDPDTTAVITLADSAGSAVAGTSTLNDAGDVVLFTPDAPLASGTTYTATLAYCSGNPEISFTTSSLGAPLAASIDGNAYIVDLNGARFLQPAGVADLLLSQLNNSILMGVQTSSPNLQMIGAISVDGGTDQDVCTPTIDFPSADFSDSPYFAVGPQDTTISAAGYDIEISQLMISGTFSADGTYFGGGVLAGQLDARVLAPLVGSLLGTKDPDAICATVAGFGVTCTECASDGQPYCLDVLVEDITATALGTAIVPRTQADVDGDSTCAK